MRVLGEESMKPHKPEVRKTKGKLVLAITSILICTNTSFSVVISKHDLRVKKSRLLKS
jgi:hypothetical protein